MHLLFYLTWRLHNDPNPSECRSFLLECVSSLATTTTTPIPSDSSSSLGDVIIQVELSCIQPRGKWILSLCKHGLTLKQQQSQSASNKQESSFLSVPATALYQPSLLSSSRRIIIFPKPEQCKSPPKPYEEDEEDNYTKNSNKKIKKSSAELIRLVLIPLDPNTVVHNLTKPITQLCFPLPVGTTITNNKEPQESTTNSSLSEKQWIQQLCESFTIYNNNHKNTTTTTTNTKELISPPTIVDIPYPQIAVPSSTTNSTSAFFVSDGSKPILPSMPFVTCYSGVNSGWLFPLQEGLLFYKPPSFLPRELFHSIACGRGGGGNATRYVDLHLQFEQQQHKSKSKSNNMETVDFTNISREELVPLNQYIHHILTPAMEQDAKTNTTTNNDEDNNDTLLLNTTRAEEEDHDVHNTDTTKRRKAAIEAVQTTRQQIIAIGDTSRKNDTEFNEDDDDEDDEYSSASFEESGSNSSSGSDDTSSTNQTDSDS
mmetsp:Transcript_3789/g.5641  ORF Transcript_3789/g.5641 Transcript_3789/m.5641 type:complete len:485 (-) Transcript_3789:51-1505(-)